MYRVCERKLVSCVRTQYQYVSTVCVVVEHVSGVDCLRLHLVWQAWEASVTYLQPNPLVVEELA